MEKRRYQEKWENAYLTVKNARASRALRGTLDPGQCMLASLALWHYVPSPISLKYFLAPPVPVLDPLLMWMDFHVVYIVSKVIICTVIISILFFQIIPFKGQNIAIHLKNSHKVKLAWVIKKLG